MVPLLIIILGWTAALWVVVSAVAVTNRWQPARFPLATPERSWAHLVAKRSWNTPSRLETSQSASKLMR
jgi:hypothetical protein